MHLWFYFFHRSQHWIVLRFNAIHLLLCLLRNNRCLPIDTRLETWVKYFHGANRCEYILWHCHKKEKIWWVEAKLEPCFVVGIQCVEGIDIINRFVNYFISFSRRSPSFCRTLQRECVKFSFRQQEKKELNETRLDTNIRRNSIQEKTICEHEAKRPEKKESKYERK